MKKGEFFQRAAGFIPAVTRRIEIPSSVFNERNGAT